VSFFLLGCIGCTRCNLIRISGVRVATFAFLPNRDGGPGVSPPENFWNSICDLEHFEAIWWLECNAVLLHKHMGLQSNSVRTCIILGLLLLLLLFSLFLFTLLRLYLEVRDIWRPGAGLAGMRDSMAQIRDIPGNPGRVATLSGVCPSASLSVTNAPNDPAQRSGLETRLHCAGSIGAAFAKPLWPFVIVMTNSYIYSTQAQASSTQTCWYRKVENMTTSQRGKMGGF